MDLRQRDRVVACAAVEAGLQAVEHAGDRRGRSAADLSQIDRAADRGQQQRGIAALHQHLRGNVLCQAGHIGAYHPEAAAAQAAVLMRIARSPGRQGPAGPGPGRDGASFRNSARALVSCGLRHGYWVGQQELADVAAEYRADDVQLIQLDRVRLPDHGPTFFRAQLGSNPSLVRRARTSRDVA